MRWSQETMRSSLTQTNPRQEQRIVEVFVDTPIEVCETRDPKGLYKKARAGEIKGFTGIDDPYEAPSSPELILSAAEKTPDELADEVLAYLQEQGICPALDPAVMTSREAGETA